MYYACQRRNLVGEKKKSTLLNAEHLLWLFSAIFFWAYQFGKLLAYLIILQVFFKNIRLHMMLSDGETGDFPFSVYLPNIGG